MPASILGFSAPCVGLTSSSLLRSSLRVLLVRSVTVRKRGVHPSRMLSHQATQGSTSSRWPYEVSSSSSTTHLKSKFQGHASHFPHTVAQSKHDNEAHDSSASHPTLDDLLEHISTLHPNTKRATHCIYAWRARLPPKVPSSPGMIISGSSDGGESGAGERLSRLLELGGYEDVIVIVHRWYGGVKLGSDRWKCISDAAKEALEVGRFAWSKEEKEGREEVEMSRSIDAIALNHRVRHHVIVIVGQRVASRQLNFNTLHHPLRTHCAHNWAIRQTLSSILVHTRVRNEYLGRYKVSTSSEMHNYHWQLRRKTTLRSSSVVNLHYRLLSSNSTFPVLSHDGSRCGVVTLGIVSRITSRQTIGSRKGE
ncbi:hypothetical protein K474DRAFT_1082817 [Panus rudis PR-1116 ss-1]|nr:hypothetical protein K474DRAFT_1082817 [Panus rudis PR-1116 ss-1]